jgi:hypothetical protein
MAHDKIGHSWKLFPGMPVELSDISDQTGVAVRLRKETMVFIRTDGSSVAQMVVADDQIAVVIEKSGKSVIASYEFHYAVHDLNDAPDLASFRMIGDPYHSVNPCLSITGSVGKVLPHCFPPYSDENPVPNPSGTSRRRFSPLSGIKFRQQMEQDSRYLLQRSRLRFP